MQSFRDAVISLNAWILLLMSERNNKPHGDSDDFCPDKSGSNMCEVFFSMLSGFGNIESGKRDCNVAEARRIASTKLTLLKMKSDDSGLKIPSRKREHDPDKEHLLKMKSTWVLITRHHLKHSHYLRMITLDNTYVLDTTKLFREYLLLTALLH
jgi:hypothetical protein